VTKIATVLGLLEKCIGASRLCHLEKKYLLLIILVFLHEPTHTVDPQVRFDEIAKGKYYLVSTNGCFPQIFNFDKSWLTIILKEWDFFKKTFFEATDDETLNLIRDNGLKGTLDAKNEFVAMPVCQPWRKKFNRSKMAA